MATRNTRPSRRRTARPAAPACEDCWHIGAQPFGITTVEGQPARIFGQIQVCCHCGRARMIYQGVVETGHGPFVLYSSPILARIPLPNGANLN